MRREEIAEYIAGMTMPLCSAASDAGLKTLAYLLEMVVLEAENTKTLAGKDKVNQAEELPPSHFGSSVQHYAGAPEA